VLTGFSDYHGEIQEILAEGDKAGGAHPVDRHPGWAVPRPTGERRKGPFTTADFFRIENGKLAEHWDVVDSLPVPSSWPAAAAPTLKFCVLRREARSSDRAFNRVARLAPISSGNGSHGCLFSRPHRAHRWRERRIGEGADATLIMSGVPSLSQNTFEPQVGQKWNVRKRPLSPARRHVLCSPSIASSWLRGKNEVEPNSAPVRRWQAMQWHDETSAGSRQAGRAAGRNDRPLHVVWSGTWLSLTARSTTQGPLPTSKLDRRAACAILGPRGNP
jgi:hypothetical protein